jgi:hypothetical protein
MYENIYRVKPWMKWVLALLVIIAALMILAPRLWVKNKAASFSVDGEPVAGTLFHGSRNRIYVELQFYSLLIDPQSCDLGFTDRFHGVGPLRFAAGTGSQKDPRCSETPPGCSLNSIEFMACSNEKVRIVWRNPPG